MTPADLTHDAAYKAMFAFPEMMTSLMRDFVHEPFVRQLDFSTLERLSGETVSLDHKLGFNDMVWKVGRYDGAPCYPVLLVEFQRWKENVKNLREARVMVSTFMLEFEAETLARGLAQGQELGLEQGLELGREQGLELGLAKSELNNQKENLRECLEDRFGKVPQAVLDFLDGATDMAVLRRLTKGAWRADSVDAFLALPAAERNNGVPGGATTDDKP